MITTSMRSNMSSQGHFRWHQCKRAIQRFGLILRLSANLKSVGLIYRRCAIHGSFATDSLSLRKLPNAKRILPIAPGKNKQIREKLKPRIPMAQVDTNKHYFLPRRHEDPRSQTIYTGSLSYNFVFLRAFVVNQNQCQFAVSDCFSAVSEDFV